MIDLIAKSFVVTGRLGSGGWILCTVASVVVLYPAYFGLLFAADSLLGGQQLLSEMLVETKQWVLLEVLSVVRDSVPVALPVVTLGVWSSLAWSAHGGIVLPALRALGSAGAVGVGLAAAGYSGMHAVVLAAALGVALMAAIVVARLADRVRT